MQRLISCTTQGPNTTPKDFEINSDGVTIRDPNYPVETFEITNSPIAGTYQIDAYMFLACADPRIAYIPGGRLFLTTPAGLPEPPYVQSFDPNDFSDVIVLDKILINVDHCLTLLGDGKEQSKDSAIQYLKRILDDFNYNCGSPWEFDLIDTSTLEPKLESGKASSRISIVDINGSKEQKKEQVYYFKAKAQESNVRTLGMKLLLPESMKTQALYGNGKSTQTPKTTETCNVRFSAFTAISGRNLTEPVPSATIKPPNCISSVNCRNEGEAEPPTLEERYDRVTLDANDKNVAGIREELLKHNNNEKINKCKGVILPLEFNVVVDGIGGFAWGQSVDCDRFPEDYRRYYKHQVTAVEHTITHADWTTNIITTGRFHPDADIATKDI